VCSALGGGGHAFAAGYTAPHDTPEAVVAAFRALLDDAVTGEQTGDGQAPPPG
jgi:phosphoesterase RecJ-like protein